MDKAKRTRKTKDTTEKKEEEPLYTLYERIDMTVLDKIISCEELEDDVRLKFKKYKQANKYGIKYYFGKDGEAHQLYARGFSLQMMGKEFRHALTKNIYWDIDMANCHPRFMLQFIENRGMNWTRLTKYITDRERILQRVMNKHNINRDQSKKLILKCMNGGGYHWPDENGVLVGPKEEGKCEWLKKFSKERKKLVNLLHPDLSYDEKNTKMSGLLASMTHECLMAMNEFFNHNGYHVGCFVFDGMMVGKKNITEDQLFDLLVACRRYIKEKTTYDVELVEKPMDIPLSVELPKYSYFVENDLEAADKLMDIVGKEKFIYCKKQLYIYDETTGMYSEDHETYKNLIIKHKKYLSYMVGEKTATYADSDYKQKCLGPLIQTACIDNEWLERTDNSSLGYLLFKNGIYNMKTGTFTKGFDPSIVFHTRIYHNYTERNEGNIKYANDLMFGSLFDDPEVMIYSLARALAGDTDIKKFYMNPGTTNSGKSHLTLALENCFGGYIGLFNAESLALKLNDTKDEGAQNRWALLLRYCRILLSNEVKMEQKLNGNLIKKFSSGDKVIGRTHNKEELKFQPHFTCFCMLNDIPKIDPYDTAVDGRIVYIGFNYEFVDVVIDNRTQKLKVEDLKVLIREDKFINGFTHIILDGYKKYLSKIIPKYDEVLKNKWTEDIKQSSLNNLVNDDFEITKNPNDFVTITNINNWKKRYPAFQTMSSTKFNEMMRSMGLMSGTKNNTRCWIGLKFKL